MAETVVVTGNTLTPLQLDVYDVICEGWLLAGEAPTQYEIAKVLRCSPHAILNAIKALSRAGHLDWKRYAVRGAKPVDPHRRLFREAPQPWDIPPRPSRLKVAVKP